jgi:lipopolysaccharide exporter
LLPERNEDAANLLAICLIIATFFSAFTIPFILIEDKTIEIVLNAPKIESYLWLLPPSLFISGISLALNYWNVRTKHFGRLSIVAISNTIASTGTKIGIGILGYASGGSLIIANLIANIISTSIIGFMIWRDNCQFFKENINQENMVKELKRYKKFPQMDAASNLLNTISWQLPNILLSSFFSLKIVGFYALGFMIIQLPMSLVGGSISRVFFQRASQARIDNTLDTMVENFIICLIQITLFPMLFLAIIGKDIFILCFGPNWAEAGIYAQILSIWAIFWFISSPLSSVIPVLERIDFDLKFSLVNLITRLLSISIGGYLHSVYIALLLFSLSGILLYGYLCIWIMKETGVAQRKVIRIFLYNLIIFIPAAMTLIIAKIIGASGLIEMTIAFIIFMIYIAYLSLKLIPNKFLKFKRAWFK